MGEKVAFQGRIVRVERDGFGVIAFDNAIGRNANTHGIFTTSISGFDVPFGSLKPGMAVSGTAEADDKDVAAVTSLKVA